jgi:hypothetical protein
MPTTISSDVVNPQPQITFHKTKIKQPTPAIYLWLVSKKECEVNAILLFSFKLFDDLFTIIFQFGCWHGLVKL